MCHKTCWPHTSSHSTPPVPRTQQRAGTLRVPKLRRTAVNEIFHLLDISLFSPFFILTDRTGFVRAICLASIEKRPAISPVLQNKPMVRAAQASPEQRARFWGHIPRGRWGWTPTD